MNPSILYRQNKLPPLICLLIARERGHRMIPIPPSEVARRAGMSLQKVLWIGEQDDWRFVTVGDHDAFLRGCGIDETNRARHIRYLRRTLRGKFPLAHIDHPSVPKRTVRRWANRLAVILGTKP